jgi:hypothetical protein
MAAVLGLAGCAGGPDPYRELAYRNVTPGARLTLNVPIEIPPGVAHVDVQVGRVGRGAAEAEPYCIFEVSTLSEAPQVIEPDTFEVWRVGRSISPSSDWGLQVDLMVAAIGIGIGIGIGSDAGYGWWAGNTPPTQLFYKTRLSLRSARQPSVLRLTCQWDQMTASGAALARHLTVSEIRAALAPTFTLSLAGEPPRP